MRSFRRFASCQPHCDRIQILLLFLLLGWTIFAVDRINAQVPSPVDTESSSTLRTGTEQAESDFRQEIAPGIVVFGKSNRFAALGDCQSFDVSPDGKTVVCSGQKLKFFDLEKNQIRDEIGEPGDYYQAVQYSPDGRFVVAYTYESSGSQLRVWDAIDLSLVNTISATIGVSDESAFKNFYLQSVAISADNSFVAMTSNNAALIRDLKTGELIHEFVDLGYVQRICFSSDETQVYLPKNSRIQVIDMDSGEPVGRSESPLVGSISQSVVVNLSRNFAALASGGRIIIKNLNGGNDRLLGLPAGCYAQQCVFSDDGSLIAVNVWSNGDTDSRMQIHVMEVDSGKLVKRIKNVGENVTRMRFSTDRRTLMLTGYGLFGLNEIDLASSVASSSDQGLSSPVAVSRIHPGKESFVVGTMAGTLNVLDLGSGKLLNQASYQGAPKGLLLSADGSRIIVYSNSWQGKINSYDYQSGKQKREYTIKGDENSVVSQLRAMMLTGGLSNANTNAFPLFASLSEGESELYSVALIMTYRSSGSAFTGFDMEQSHSIKFVKFNVETGATTGSMNFSMGRLGIDQNQWVQVAAISRDGKLLAIADNNRALVIDLESGQDAYEIEGEIQVGSLAFSPDNRFLLTLDQRQICRVWDRETGGLIKELTESPSSLMPTFSEDGKKMLVCPNSKQATVEVYRTDTWEPVFQRDGTQADRSSARLSGDGQHIVFGLTDCRIEVWDLAKLK